MASGDAADGVYAARSAPLADGSAAVLAVELDAVDRGVLSANRRDLDLRLEL
ncbi:MAG: hypothetical protein HYV63_02890 [Candidatus Schekmanbacteria bacterium]|nr:hypothetical protein [Candidatus Schekmanbacteria bacterium]